MRVGLTLPSFVRDVDELLAVAVAAEAAGIDGVFVYDHLFRFGADGSRRPALESTAMMGAVAAETRRIHVGVLVERATLRPPAITAFTLATVHKLSAGFVGAIGAGDHESREENESFGLDFGTIESRLTELRDAVCASRDQGFPVWVGGKHPRCARLRRRRPTAGTGGVATPPSSWRRPLRCTPRRFGRALSVRGADSW